MTDVAPSIADAQAEVEKAAADLAAAEGAGAVQDALPVPPSPAEVTVRLGTTNPWVNYDPGDGLPLVTFDGIDVSETIAEKVLSAASPSGMPLRKD